MNETPEQQETENKKPQPYLPNDWEPKNINEVPPAAPGQGEKL